jgi:16S rRNA (guanine527-N7)-methyltransferase
VQWLATAGVERGLIGPREIPRLWDRHVLNCAVAVDLAVPNASVLDVGSGAGLPGLVWALVRPDLTVTLVEPLQRRVDFLREVVADLQVAGRVQICRARAEDLAGKAQADVVTCRAVAPWSRLAGWCLPLVTVDGVVAALKGASARAELAAAASDLLSAGAGATDVVVYGADVLEQPTHVALVRPRSAHPRDPRPRGGGG